MRRFAIRMAAHRRSALIAVAGAVLGGAALVTATGVIAESGLRSHLPADRLAGADVVVTAAQSYRAPEDLPLALPERTRIPADLTARLARLPDVTTAVGDLSFPAAILTGPSARPGQAAPASSREEPATSPGKLPDASAGVLPSAVDPGENGHGWSSAALLAGARTAGQPPQAYDEVAVDAATGFEPGDRVEIVAAGRTGSYRVTALLTGAHGGVFFADPAATALAGRAPGTVDLIGLRATPGHKDQLTDSVRRELRGTGLTVVSGAARGDAVAPAATAARSLLVLLAGSLAGIIAIIVGFVVAGALAVSISGQRRDLALLRAVGATPRQIRRLAATQALAVTAVALVPGLALGYPLAGQFRRLLAGQGLLPETLPLSYSPLPALAAVLLISAVVLLSAYGSAWRTSRMPATEAVAESTTEPKAPSPVRTSAGFILMLFGTAMSAVPLLARSPLSAASSSLAGILGAVGLALAGPDLVRRGGDALARRLPARTTAPTWLAVANLRGYVIRVGGVVASLAMMVVFVLTYTLAQTTVGSAGAGEAKAGTLAQVSVGAPALGGVPGDLIGSLQAVPGVRATMPTTTTTVLWPFRQFGDPTVESQPAMVLTPAAPDVLDLGVEQGDLRKLTGATVAVGSDAARTRNAGPGRTIDLILGDGTKVKATVVAVYSRDLGFGPLVVSRDLVAGHTTTGLDTGVLIRTDGSPQALQGLSALAASRPGLVVGGAGSPAGTLPPETWINLALVVVLLGYLLLSIANRLVAATTQRRAEIAVLRLSGTTPRQIRAMIRREAALITAAALGLGVLLSAAPLALLGIGFLGRPWPAGPFWVGPAAALTVAVTAFLTMELPTRRALRIPPAEALRTP